MRRSAVAVSGAEFDADQIQHAVSDAALRDHFLRKFAHPLYGTLEHQSLDALIMIQMGVHCGHREAW